MNSLLAKLETFRTLPENTYTPLLLTAMIAVMLVHAAMFGDWQSQRIRADSFLSYTLIQLLPLCALKAKIMSSGANRLSNLSRTASKILFMHLTVLSLRVLGDTMKFTGFIRFTIFEWSSDLWANAAFLIGAIYIMAVVCEFKGTFLEFMMHSDIALLHILGMVHTAFDRYIRKQEDFQIAGFIDNYANSMEMLAYMPALWISSRVDQKLLTYAPLTQLQSQRQAIWFLAWMITFNAYEDFVGMLMSGVKELHFLVGKLFHFLLLFDFSALFLQQAYDTTREKEEAKLVPVVGFRTE